MWLGLASALSYGILDSKGPPNQPYSEEKGKETQDSLLDKANQTLLLGKLNELLVVLQLLCGWLGNQDVVTQVERFRGDGEVGRVRSEDDDG